MLQQSNNQEPKKILNGIFNAKAVIELVNTDESITPEQTETMAAFGQMYGCQGLVKPGKACNEAAKKLETTLKRLKENGIYKKSINAILSNSTTDICVWLWLRAMLNDINKQLSVDVWPDPAAPIRDEFWTCAIETIVVEHATEALTDDSIKNYTLIVKQHTTELYILVTLMAYADAVKKDRELQNSDSVQSKERKRLENELRLAEEHNKSLQAQNEKLKKENSDLSAIRQSYDTKLRKTQLSIEHEYSQKEKEYEEIISFYQRQNEILRGVIKEGFGSDSLLLNDDNEDENIWEDELDSTDDESDLDSIISNEKTLPETGILFLGGHETLVNKIKKLHPGWTFVCDGNKRTIYDMSGYKAAFVCAKYLSHKLYYRFTSKLTDDIPVLYVSATNIEKLETEMSESYRILSEELPSVTRP